MSPIPTGKAVLVEGHLLQCGGACPVSLPQLQAGAVVLGVSAVYPPPHPSHRLALRRLAWPGPPCSHSPADRPFLLSKKMQPGLSYAFVLIGSCGAWVEEWKLSSRTCPLTKPCSDGLHIL